MAKTATSSVVAFLGPFQFGVALVILNTMLNDVSEDLGFDRTVGGGVVSSALFLGAGVGGLMARPLENVLGEHGQLCLSLLFAAGNVLCGASIDQKLCQGASLDGCVPAMILAGRLITGFASGLALAASPRSLALTSLRKAHEGKGAYILVSIAFGSFLGLLIGLPLQVESLDINYEWWRIMFFIATAPAILQYFLALDYLSRVRKSRSASEERLKQARMGETQKLEMAEGGTQSQILPSLPEDTPFRDQLSKDSSRTAENHSIETQKRQQNLSSCFEKQYRRCVLFSIGVPVACQLSGLAVVASYSTMIIEDAGLDHPIVGSIIFGVGNLISGSISAFVCDQFNRKTLVYTSFAGMGLSYLGLALSSLADSHVSGFLSVILLEAFIVSFAAGCGFISVNYASEVVPPELAVAVGTIGHAFSVFVSLLLVLVFPLVLGSLGILWTFAILSIGPFGALAFLHVYMIETKGRDSLSVYNEHILPRE